MKSPLTPAGIEPATYRFVAQHLNHCATAVPYRSFVLCQNSKENLHCLILFCAIVVCYVGFTVIRISEGTRSECSAIKLLRNS